MEVFEFFSICVTLFLVYKLLDWVVRIPRVGNLEERRVLITGCDTGFGREAARTLDDLGCHVFATCVTEHGESDLRKGRSSRFKTIHLDVSNHKAVLNALDFVERNLPEGRGLWGVINNAGIAGRRIGPCEWLTLEDYRDMLNVNLLGVVDVSMTFLPLIKREKGRLVNVASVHGRTSLIGNAPYSCAKYGVEAFSDNLRRQLRPFNCSVHLIEPGFHITNIVNPENTERALRSAWDQSSPETKQEYGEEYLTKALDAFLLKFIPKIASRRVGDVVNAYTHALFGRVPRARYVVGMDAKFFWLPVQWMPEWLGDWIMEFMADDAPIPAACKTT